MVAVVWFFEPPLEEIIEGEDPSNEGEEDSEDEEEKKNK